MKKLLVVDGNSIMNRAFFGVRALQTKDGLFTNAVFGTANIIKKDLDLVHPDYFAVAFDVHAPTFRHKAYDKYKSNRHGMPEELHVQEPYIHQLMEGMGAKCIEMEGFEADDLLGTLSMTAEKEGIHTYLVTGDRDSLQLISRDTTVLLATNGDSVEFTPETFFEKYGVRPDQFIDVKALMGDSSDCIPGVAGIGEKTALKLIAENGSLDKIYENLEELKLSPSVREKLKNGKESAYMSQWLATIKRDVPIGEPLESFATSGFRTEQLSGLFTRLEFTGLIKKFGLESTESDSSAPVSVSVTAASVEELETERMAFLADPVKKIYYFCDGKKYASTEDRKIAEAMLKKAGSRIVFDKKTQMHEENGMEELRDSDDVMLMGYVLSASENDYSLEKLISREFVTDAADAEQQIRYLIPLYDAYLSRMNENEKKLYREMELPLSLVLYEMEESGFKVDTARLNEFSEQLLEMQKQLELRIFMAAGEEFNINSPKQLGEVLFDKMGLPNGKKTKTGYSTNAEVLESLRPYSPIVDDILDYRQVGKLRSTYAIGLAEAADENGRVHTCFKQALTATGRLSSTEPNLQNIPVRTELGREFRKFFIPENDGYVLVDADYSQIELRLLAAISGDKNMIDGFLSGYDIHTATAMKVFHVPAEFVDVALRKRAKAINFGIVYGIGEYSLANDIGVSYREASDYIRSYFETYPEVKKYLDDVVVKAHKDKYVETLFGRKRYIPQLMSSKKAEVAFGERVAMNSPIQGTAADIIKLAMVHTAERLRQGGYDARLVLQVHDELIIECKKECSEEIRALLKEEMENAVHLSVPLTVEIGAGNTWYEAH